MQNQAVTDILQETRKLLAFHQSVGIEAYPTTDGLRSFIAESAPGPTAAPAAPQRQPAPFRGAPAEPTKQPPLTADDATLEEIRNDLGDCKRCTLGNHRKSIVFGAGAGQADLLIVGEWPDNEEEREGKPFQGENGLLLDRMLAAIGMSREQVYLTNIVKCSPGEGQPPGAEEIKACRPFLIRQIAVVNPKIILTMGPLAARTLLKTSQPLSRLRGRFHSFRGIDLMPTFHPGFLIANIEMKKATWVDLQMVQKRCGRGR